MSAAASSPVKAEAMEAAVSLGGRGAGAGYGSPTGTDGGNGKVSTEAKVSGELATVGDAAAGMGSVDPVPQATSAKTMESLQAMPGGNLSNISVGIRGVGKGTATSAQLLERPINGWNATTGVEGAEGVPKLAAVAGVKNTGMNQAAVEATISNVDEDSQLVREHVALTLDDGEKTSSASTIQAAENSTTAVAANEANSTADTTRAAGSTNVADAIHYNNTNVWTGWAVTKATSLNGRTVDLPTDASSKKTDAGKGAAGVVTEDDVKAGAQVGTIASANDSTITTKPVMATETARFVEGTASNSTGALDELDAFVSTATDSSRVQAAAGKGSVVDNGTGSAGGTSEEGTKIVISSAGGSTKTEAGDAWGWQIDHQVDGRVSDVEARRGHGDVEREQGQQNRGRRVRTGRNRFGRMQEQFQQHQSSDGAHARGASTSQVSVGVVTESTSTGTGRGAAIRAADALATMGAANDGETTDVATTGSGTGENASTHAADEHSGVLVDEEEQDHVE
ncbi:hypothetical protein Vretifemale_1638 [Volvox reticuliferus]|nr:hypothetical protein Vretifemale_1638 [Volvox reticuliferus]